jgi:acetyl-CoA carboxylase biotin carboxyl carrier protein
VDIKDINKLIDKITEKGITDFEIEQDDFRLRIAKKTPEAPAIHSIQQIQPVQGTNPQPTVEKTAEKAEDKVEETDNFHKVISPMVGTFYRAPSPGAKPYVAVGDRVRKGQVCCIVEAMKIMNEIQSDVDGVIRAIHTENEQPVEFGEPLFSVEVN